MTARAPATKPDVARVLDLLRERGERVAEIVVSRDGTRIVLAGEKPKLKPRSWDD